MVFTRQGIEKMDEADLRRNVIMPLMEAMGYLGVFEWHGGNELGKDVVGWQQNNLGSRRNTAVVAKAGRISGNSAVGVVATQVAQSFKTSFYDQLTGTEEKVHHCWIVGSGRLGKEARARIRAALPVDQDRDVEILDGDDLWKYVQKYMPGVAFQGLLNELGARLKAVDTPFGIGLQIPANGSPIASVQVGITTSYSPSHIPERSKKPHLFSGRTLTSRILPKAKRCATSSSQPSSEVKAHRYRESTLPWNFQSRSRI